MFYIYALLDPISHLVRYVGQTRQVVSERYRQHCKGTDPATGEWVLTLPEKPGLIVLETGISSRVRVGVSGKRVVRRTTVSAASFAETKWIKRFRRTLINRKMRGSCPTVWDALVNPKDGNDVRD